MKLTIGWWKARNGSKWHVVWVKGEKALAHNELGDDAWCFFSDGRWSKHGAYEIDLIAPWSEPELRPWKEGEIQLGIWMRYKETKFRWMAISDAGTEMLLDWFEKCEHSNDGGKTWHPCGVVKESNE